MLKDKGGILYHGDFEGRNLNFVSDFKNKKEAEKKINDYIINNGFDIYQRYIYWDEPYNEETKMDCFVNVTIDYGSYNDFLLIVYDD